MTIPRFSLSALAALVFCTTLISCAPRGSRSLNESTLKNYEGKTLHQLLDSLGDDYDTWYPIWEEHWVEGCVIDYTTKYQTILRIKFRASADTWTNGVVPTNLDDLADITIEEVSDFTHGLKDPSSG